MDCSNERNNMPTMGEVDREQKILAFTLTHKYGIKLKIKHNKYLL